MAVSEEGRLSRILLGGCLLYFTGFIISFISNFSYLVFDFVMTGNLLQISFHHKKNKKKKLGIIVEDAFCP